MSTPPAGRSENEQRLWHAVRDGDSLDHSVAASASRTQWPRSSNGRSVDAQVLASLLLQPPSLAPGAVTRLQIAGAHVTGRLRLRHARVEVPLDLVNCTFEEPIELDDAVLRTASF